MDPYYGLINPQLQSDEENRALAKALRAQAASGAGLASSQLAEVSDQGRLMQTSARDTARDIGLQQYRAQASRDDRLADALAAQAENQFTKISGGRADKLYDETERASTVLSLANVMGDAANPGGIPLMGTATNWLATNAPGVLPQDAKDRADMWRSWNMEYNNITRHGLFGSALTGPERAAWRAASVNENMEPEQIQRNMDILRGIMQGKAARRALALINEKRNPQWIYDTYADVLPPEFWEDPRGWRDMNKRQTEEILKGIRLEDLNEEDLDRMIADMEDN